MDKDNFERSLRSFVKRKPFLAFSVELVSGERILIEHPEALVTRGGVAFYIGSDGEINLFDHNGVNRFIGYADQPASA